MREPEPNPHASMHAESLRSFIPLFESIGQHAAARDIARQADHFDRLAEIQRQRGDA